MKILLLFVMFTVVMIVTHHRCNISTWLYWRANEDFLGGTPDTFKFEYPPVGGLLSRYGCTYQVTRIDCKDHYFTIYGIMLSRNSDIYIGCQTTDWTISDLTELQKDQP